MICIVRASLFATLCALVAAPAVAADNYPERPIRLIVPFLPGGQITVYMSTFASALPHVKQERLRALAVTTLKRAGPLPDVPTLAESGVQDYEYASWYGLFAPADTPRPVIDKIHKAAVGSLKSSGVLQVYEAQGLNATPTTPAEFAKYIASERAKWAGVVREAKITQQ